MSKPKRTPTQGEAQASLTIRFPAILVDRLDALIKPLARPGEQLTRADVVRLALARGIEELET